MTQEQIILEAFERGERFMDSDVWRKTDCQVSGPSFKRIVSQLRARGVPIQHIEKVPERGGHAFYEYFLGKAKVMLKYNQHSTLCECGNSWWSYGGKCNMCGVARG